MGAVTPRDLGPAAFPIGGYDGVEFTTREPGMSLRDWFAGQALAAFGTWSPAPYNSTQEAADLVRAKRAYEIADAMLSERAKP